jgi:hypothetical protein
VMGTLPSGAELSLSMIDKLATPLGGELTRPLAAGVPLAFRLSLSPA